MIFKLQLTLYYEGVTKILMKHIFKIYLMATTVLFSGMIDHKLTSNPMSTMDSKSIKFLDAKELNFKSRNLIEVKELSALAYKDTTLYALTDKGVLLDFTIKIEDNKIKGLTLNKLTKLRNKKNEVLKKSHRDSEGLSFIGSDLLISFERKARVEVFSTQGIKIKSKKIHQDLKDIKNFRSKNKALEAVAYNEKYGVVTAPEKSLSTFTGKGHVLYAKDRIWKFPASGSITALEFMSKNKLMILERKLNDFSRRRVTTISMLNLKNNNYQVLAKLDSRDGWNLDNFEGLTKVDKRRYLMISDDNDSFFQKTLLVLFEVSLK